MLYHDIAASLPKGLSRSTFAQWLEGGARTGWVRAGDLRRQHGELILAPRWDGEAFRLLFQAALRQPLAPTGPRVRFAVQDGHRLVTIAEVGVDHALRRQVRDAIPRR